MAKDRIHTEITNLGDWGNIPFICPVTIITTVNKKGKVNAAIKSWITPACSTPPLLLFSCNIKHDTAKNILETREFVVNIPMLDIKEKTLITAKEYPPEVNELKEAGLTPIPTERVKPPAIEECIAHLECILEWQKQYGDEIIICGRVLSASCDRKICEASMEEKQRILENLMITLTAGGTILK
ncbi:flavin reductase family protein [candidate division WOR-3 bacterium]|nr:flavin reductase family protein [candidate division WOR-3 bacterium]